jgi:hypothetical protein
MHQLNCLARDYIYACLIGSAGAGREVLHRVPQAVQGPRDRLVLRPHSGPDFPFGRHLSRADTSQVRIPNLESTKNLLTRLIITLY